MPGRMSQERLLSAKIARFGIARRQRLRVNPANHTVEGLIEKGIESGFGFVGGVHLLSPKFAVGLRWCATCS
jgi:hypothetical protein